MPNMTVEHFSSPQRKLRRFRVKATGETGTALSEHGTGNVHRMATMGPALNVALIDLCNDATGEVRTFRAEYLEEVEA